MNSAGRTRPRRVSINERFVREMATLNFVFEATNVLLSAREAAKTHLAVTIAIRAIKHGQGIHFVRAHQLLKDLSCAQAEHRPDRRLRVYLTPKVSTALRSLGEPKLGLPRGSRTRVSPQNILSSSRRVDRASRWTRRFALDSPLP